MSIDTKQTKNISHNYAEKIECLPWGDADLGAYKQGRLDAMIEVGTTSFRKIYLNLVQLNNFIYLIVPNDNRLIGFKKHLLPY